MATDVSSHRRLSLLILASLLVFAAAVVLRVGLGLTDYDTTDSQGRPIGFNDPLSWEHYGIMVRNFEPSALLEPEHIYDGILLAMHLAGFTLLWSRSLTMSRWTRWFFAIQPLLFPLGVLLAFILPLVFLSVFTGGMDREGFVDLPFILIVSQPVWLLASTIIMLRLRGPALGVARVWSALRESGRAGARTFAQAMR